MTQRYRGASCNECNLKATVPDFIPVFFHNLSGYDSHLFATELGSDNGEISIIPQNTERYISISKKVSEKMTLRFLDTFRFMPSSLDTLAKNLIETPDKFKHVQNHFPPEHVTLLLRKGVYPYDYMNNIERFKDETLPQKEAFYNKLNECHINDEDYLHAQRVWENFKIKNMGQYSDLYVKTDVLLLADIFDNFRNVCHDTYGLDPAWYYTAPGLSWDSMLKKTDVKIELLTDCDKLLFIEKGVRGGISQCSTRYGIANNKYLPEQYNSNKPSNYLLYLDANNLYGWAMSQFLPIKDFKWANADITPDYYLNVPDDNPIGYILEVDFIYPFDIHDYNSDFPLAPETSKPPGCKEKRLLTTLNDKDKYILHYRNLKQYVKFGLKLKTIHRVLQFQQTQWLKQYIDLNTQLRQTATNDFTKNFYKLMNNSIFGKTMENIRKRVNIKLTNNGENAEKWIARSNFQDRTIFDENLVALHMRKTTLKFNKPITVGMVVLDLSKTLMYEFHYGHMKEKYKDSLKLLYTDTDSFIYDIETEDVYKDMLDDIDLFDTSDYPQDNTYNIPLINKKVIGKMKDETKGKAMSEFIGLRSKMYTYKVGGETTKKLKGVKRVAIETKIDFEDYQKCLFQNNELLVKMNCIRSKKHNLYSIAINKLALSPYDQKRHVFEDKISTVAFGHYCLL